MDIANKPDLSHTEALEIVERHYGIVGEAATLPGERDQNFRISLDDGRQYVLKIAHPEHVDEKLVKYETWSKYLRDAKRNFSNALWESLFTPTKTPLIQSQLPEKEYYDPRQQTIE